MVSQQDLRRLKEIIIDNIKKEFAIKKLSGNLVKTIVVEEYEGKIKINIPAPTYDILLYSKMKVVVHNGRGSYASSLDKQGSKFSKGSHKGFVKKVVNQSVEMWLKETENRYEVQERF